VLAWSYLPDISLSPPLHVEGSENWTTYLHSISQKITAGYSLQ